MFTHTCRLAPECLCIARQEFYHMLELDIIHPSSSQLVVTLAHGSQTHPRQLVTLWVLPCSITQPSLTVILFLISMILPPPCKEPQFSCTLTLFMHTTKYMSYWKTSQKWLLPRLLDSLSLLWMPFVFRNAAQMFNILLMKYFVVSTSVMHIILTTC